MASISYTKARKSTQLNAECFFHIIRLSANEITSPKVYYSALRQGCDPPLKTVCLVQNIIVIHENCYPHYPPKITIVKWIMGITRFAV